MVSRRSLLRTAAVLPLAPAQTLAQSPAAFPRRPIAWVLPFPPGGFGDVMSRVVVRHMSVTLRTPVVVDNRPGAAGQIAAAHVKQMPADGYTLFNGDMGSFAMNAALYPRLAYDTLKDFTPLTRLVTSSLVVVVPSSSPFGTFDDLVRAAKGAREASPVLYGSFSVGSLSHIWVELLKKEIKGRFRHVAYKGSAAALQDLMAGRVDMMLDLVANAGPYVRDGRLRALAVMGTDKRIEHLPDVPTLAELGHATLDASGWNGVAVRAGTPVDIVNQLHLAVQEAIRSEEISRRFGQLGIVAAPQSPAEFARYIQTETQRWGAIIRGAGVVLE